MAIYNGIEKEHFPDYESFIGHHCYICVQSEMFLMQFYLY